MKVLPSGSTFEAFFPNGFDAAFVLNHDRIFRKMNLAAVELPGYQPKELIGQPLAKVLPPEVDAVHGGLASSYLNVEEHQPFWTRPGVSMS